MAQELERDLRHVVAHAGPVWEQLAGSNIFLSGGSGFVGSWLLRSFIWANEQLKLNAHLTVLTRNSEKLKWAAYPSLEVVEGDLKTTRFPQKDFQYVIHAAAEYEDLTANLEATRRILDMARMQGTRRFLFTSSGAVYGEQPPDLEKVHEDFMGTAVTEYGVMKRRSETLCLQAARPGLGVVITRLFAFVGPYLPMNANFAVGNFVRDARLGRPILVEGDGTPLRSYLYAADLAIWLWVLLTKGISTRVYNVGSDQAISILELARTVEKVCAVKNGITLKKAPSAGAKTARYVPSIERARVELGLVPLIPLDEGIRRMFDFP